MEHVLYFDGNQREIAWCIQTENSMIEQIREHADIYIEKVNDIQSKYIALHVGLFWGIGAFVIKSGDTVIIKLDEKSMLENLESNKKESDKLIQKRIGFIKQLMIQRKLKIKYELISSDENIASRIIFCNGA